MKTIEENGYIKPEITIIKIEIEGVILSNSPTNRDGMLVDVKDGGSLYE